MENLKHETTRQWLTNIFSDGRPEANSSNELLLSSIKNSKIDYEDPFYSMKEDSFEFSDRFELNKVSSSIRNRTYYSDALDENIWSHSSPSKSRIFYSGNSEYNNDNSLSDLFIAKSQEEIIIEQAKKSLVERYNELLSVVKDDLYKPISLSKINSYDEIIDSYRDIDIDFNIRASLYRDFKIIEESTIVLKTIIKSIKRIQDSVKKYLRDLKDTFTRNHSFHFKNLDDYHSLILINNSVN